MIIGIHDYNNHNNRANAIFKSSSYSIGDNLHAPALALYNQLQSMGHSLDTLDSYPIEQYRKVIFFDRPAPGQIDIELLRRNGSELYLVMLESKIIRPDNHDRVFHSYFEKVFTWDDSLVDNAKYFKIQISHLIPAIKADALYKRNKFCCLIAGNKCSALPGELYTERRKAIRWFEQNHPEKFDLFGFGWDTYEFPGVRPLRFLNRFRLLKKICAPKYPSYRGTIDNKATLLADYRFSLCYENVQGIQGYITEKIFDSLFSLCIPIYWGAPDIGRYIPESCYIDRLQFKDTEDLFDYLVSMSETEYRRRFDAMVTFLTSEKIKVFSCETFADTIIKQLGL